MQNGADPSKLILGMPLYGRGFVLNNPANNGFNADANQPISAGPYTREAGIWGYNEVDLMISFYRISFYNQCFIDLREVCG